MRGCATTGRDHHHYHTNGHCKDCGHQNIEADVRDEYDFFDMGEYQELLGIRRPPALTEVSVEVVERILAKLSQSEEQDPA